MTKFKMVILKELPMDISMGRGPRHYHTLYVTCWFKINEHLKKHGYDGIF